jgi:serine/threonine protein kinase
MADAFPAPGATPASANVFRDAGRRLAEREAIPVPPAAPPDTRTYFAAALAVATRLAQGVAFLHKQGIRHRDLKPSNVLIDWDGHPVILDFNLAERAATDLPRFHRPAPRRWNPPVHGPGTDSNHAGRAVGRPV